VYPLQDTRWNLTSLIEQDIQETILRWAEDNLHDHISAEDSQGLQPLAVHPARELAKAPHPCTAMSQCPASWEQSPHARTVQLVVRSSCHQHA
jgi:hypothetical protein